MNGDVTPGRGLLSFMHFESEATVEVMKIDQVLRGVFCGGPCECRDLVVVVAMVYRRYA